MLHRSQSTASSGSHTMVLNKMRGLVAAAGACALLLCASAGAKAQGIRVMLNGERVHFLDIGPQEVDGRVLVPVRGVMEQLGAHVSWVPDTETVIARNDNVSIRLRLGDRTARVNGRDVDLDVPAQTIGDHTMVPLRFLGEALGARVRWDDTDRTVFIMTGDNPAPNPPIIHNDNPNRFHRNPPRRNNDNNDDN